MPWPKGQPLPPGAGRKPGTPNKRAAAHLLEAKRAVAEARARGHKLAKEVADEFMNIFARLALEVRPVTEWDLQCGRKPNPRADIDKFKELSEILRQWVALLLPYQSARFQSIRVDVGELGGEDMEEVGALETLERLLDAYADAQERDRKTIESQVTPALPEPSQPEPAPAPSQDHLENTHD
jgi:hypothetical protein